MTKKLETFHILQKAWKSCHWMCWDMRVISTLVSNFCSSPIANFGECETKKKLHSELKTTLGYLQIQQILTFFKDECSAAVSHPLDGSNGRRGRSATATTAAVTAARTTAQRCSTTTCPSPAVTATRSSKGAKLASTRSNKRATTAIQ